MFECFDPAPKTDTPPVTRRQSRKRKPRTGRTQVVSTAFAELKKLLGHHCTDLMPAAVFVDIVTTTIPKVAGYRVSATWLQFRSEDVRFLRH